ncbi:MAG: hypothetical protein KJ621_19695 [Proteobacteria bacterium]|nr:hypothetical protein [Pseudomonadota bacterium]MBU1741386.1 hypothetical protein [Pseudomonadota bacterium]
MDGSGDRGRASNAPPARGPKAERIVVDEVFANGTARLLRSRRASGADATDYRIEAWTDEREDFLKCRLVEGFVGFVRSRRLQEGDVFFVVDGSLLNRKFDPKSVTGAEARQRHLLLDPDGSRELSRIAIKEQFYKLSAAQITEAKVEDVSALAKTIEGIIKTNVFLK